LRPVPDVPEAWLNADGDVVEFRFNV